MIAALLWIVGCYVLAAAVIYALSAIRRRQSRSVKHYVLIAGNEGQRMEWYMRSLRRFSHLTGTDVKVTVVDNGSEDDTLDIARVFAKRGMDVHVHAGGNSGENGRVSAQVQGHENEQNRGQGEGLGQGQGSRQGEGHGQGLGQGPDQGQGQEQEQGYGQGSRQGQERGQRQDQDSRQDQGQDREQGQLRLEAGRSLKWKRLCAIWQWRIGDQDGIGGNAQTYKRSTPVEPTHLLWMLQAEGVVSAKEHAVLVDLRNPDDLSKLPF
ncbi:glycosyltransferase family 2 protein [Paenibacillus lycopersici]|uniref:Glycosyltransferase family 2 protein n=1 Tax=Paenibacillus lycopersici TaxID=2704462 RepID=A0A6C0G246_9BACL|nr:glycosyltransferase family A protein [Paenibacillus lycopersici]QHT63456.1 glycosyltransferase family 2 protein [Paenibacillus lycopersici]